MQIVALGVGLLSDRNQVLAVVIVVGVVEGVESVYVVEVAIVEHHCCAALVSKMSSALIANNARDVGS